MLGAVSQIEKELCRRRQILFSRFKEGLADHFSKRCASGLPCGNARSPLFKQVRF
jgi:hypothetical protein